MSGPFELVWWALGIGLAWMILISMTGLDDWLKRMAGRSAKSGEYERRIHALEKRVAELEKPAAAKL